MEIKNDRIKKAQKLMRKNNMMGLMIINHDDYQYFFGETRIQPRAIIPVRGQPIFICFKSEEHEIKQALGTSKIKVFSHVGEQMVDVKSTFQGIMKGLAPLILAGGATPRVGMQMLFQTPAFLVDLFRKLNPQIELVSSDPVMDELRMVKESEEIILLRKAQQIAAQGMDRARELLQPGREGHEIATEVTYLMMKAGASGTSTPIYINSGLRSCWIHGKFDQTQLEHGDLVVINLTPRYQGYCGNLARTFVIGDPDQKQNLLLSTYKEIVEVTRNALKPGVSVARLDKLGKQVCQEAGLGDYHINGISHGIGLRFEETPAPTILPNHRTIKIKENMVMTIGHTILAIPGFGGVRFEDLYQVTNNGGFILHDYPINPVVG
jgi:Xaa-Pro aminopeptidase